MTDWEDLTLWQKITDKDPRRPPKTLHNIVFWTWPIHTYVSGKIRQTEKRFQFKRDEVNNKLIYIQIKTRRYKGQTYKNTPLSSTIRIYWYGWNWGWKNS